MPHEKSKFFASASRNGRWPSYRSPVARLHLRDLVLFAGGQLSTQRPHPCNPPVPPARDRMASKPCPWPARLEGRRGLFEVLRIVGLDPYGRMRTEERTLSALDAQVRIPGGDFNRDVALLVLDGSGGPRSIGRDPLTGMRSPSCFIRAAVTFFTKAGASSGTKDDIFSLPAGLAGTLTSWSARRLVHRLVVHLNHFFAFRP